MMVNGVFFALLMLALAMGLIYLSSGHMGFMVEPVLPDR